MKVNPCHAKYFMYYIHSNIHLVNMQQFSCKHILSIRVENSVDPDQMASSRPADLDIYCFQKRINQGLAGQELRKTLQI